MKNILKIMVLIFAIIQKLVAQEIPCNEKEITTNPDAPINDQHPNYLNNFDWRVSPFNAYYFDQHRTQSNPYVTGQGGVNDLFGHDDYKVEDGWELLYVDLGYDREGNISEQRSGNLIIILYNKYRSFIRVFTSITQISTADLIEIEFQIPPTSSYRTAILSSIDKVQKPLRYFDPSNIASNSQVFVNISPNQFLTHWYYADFHVNYDPCSCMPAGTNTGTPQLLFNYNLISTAKIDLTGTSTGTATMAEKTSTPTITSNWDRFYGNVKKVGETLESGNKMYKTFGSFSLEAKKEAEGKSSSPVKAKSGIDNIAMFLTSSAPILKNVPYVAEALAIIDFFVGGGKKKVGPTEVRFPPLAMELNHNFSGSIRSSPSYGFSELYIPGTVANEPVPPSGVSYDPKYPIYNEVLGVYTLLDKPVVDIYEGIYQRRFETVYFSGYQGQPGSSATISTDSLRRVFKINKESIKIALNPASNLSIKNIYIQLKIWPMEGFEPLSILKSNSFLNKSGNTLISDLIPIDCIENYPIFYDYNLNYEYQPPPMFGTPIPAEIEIGLSTILVFEDLQNNNYIHKNTWEIIPNKLDYAYPPDNTNPSVHEYNWFDKPEFIDLDFLHYFKLENLEIENTSISASQYVQDYITIGNTTITSHQLEIVAGEYIEINPDAEIDVNTNLYIYKPGINCTSQDFSMAIASQTDIINICNSNEYTLSRSRKINFEKNENTNIELIFNIYPNPANQFIMVAVEGAQDSEQEWVIDIQDLSGRIISSKSYSLKEDKVRIDVTAYKAGVYMLHTRAGTQSKVHKVVVQH